MALAVTFAGAIIIYKWEQGCFKICYASGAVGNPCRENARDVPHRKKVSKLMPENKVDTAPVTETKVDTAGSENTEQKTVAEINAEAVESSEKKPETVGLDKFLEVKNQKKVIETEKEQLATRVQELEAMVKKGASNVDISDEIAAIGDEFEVDKNFLAKLTNAITAKAEAKADAKAEERLKPLQQATKDKAIDDAFTKHYAEALKSMPEYEQIANPKVIKSLSLLKENADKTFPEIIEETYGNLASSGRTPIERTVPGGGKEPQPLDIAKALKDNDYFSEVMANPKLKAEYNKAMLERRM